MNPRYSNQAKASDLSVSFETKCWEGDWEYLLKTDRLKRMIGNHSYPFAERNLILNNIVHPKAVIPYAQKAIDSGIIDHFYFAEDYADTILNYFQLAPDFKKDPGYKYSLAELVGIYLAKGDYLLHYSSDSIFLKGNGHWIDQAIEIIESNEQIKAASPVEDRAQRRHYSKQNQSRFFISHLSDQCYLVPSQLFKTPIYGETNPGTNIYPEYGGNSFEKRVGAYFMNHDYKRIVFTDVLFYSMNFSHLNRIKPILLWLGKDISFLFSYFADIRRMLANVINR